MKTYRCFLLSGERIQSVQVLECEDDNEASTKGTMLLEAKPEHQCVEIWQGARLVARAPRRNDQHASHKVIRLVPKAHS
jgi:hypothetical protein